jgi:hypothetical protein
MIFADIILLRDFGNQSAAQTGTGGEWTFLFVYHCLHALSVICDLIFSAVSIVERIRL